MMKGIRTRAVTMPTAAGLRIRWVRASPKRHSSKTRMFFNLVTASPPLHHEKGRGIAVALDRLFPWQAGKGGRVGEAIRTDDEVLRRVQCEFLEMPGLRLTEAQARRLWGLDAASCGALLGALVDQKFLFRTRDGAFMRVEHAMPVKASLNPRGKK